MELRATQRFIPIERLMFPLVFALLAAISAASLLARTEVLMPKPLDDPFLTYSDVFPGQTWSTALAQRFSCFESTLPSVADVSEECVYHPEGGPFSQVHVIIWDGVIMWLDFTARENVLTFGDLSLWWGKAEFDSYSEFVRLRWPDRRVIAVVQSQTTHITYFSPVRHISFTL